MVTRIIITPLSAIIVKEKPFCIKSQKGEFVDKYCSLDEKRKKNGEKIDKTPHALDAGFWIS